MATTYTLISSNVLGSTTASVTFSSIPSTYTDLVITGSVRDALAGTNGNILVRFNSDSATNYSYRNVRGNGASAFSAGPSNTDSIVGIVNGNDATVTTNSFSTFELYVPNYLVSANKPASIDVTQEWNSASPVFRSAVAGLWRSTAAISSLTILASAGSSGFLAGSSFYLYGIKNS